MHRTFSLRRYRSHVTFTKDSAIIETAETDSGSPTPTKTPRLYRSLSRRILRRSQSRVNRDAPGDTKIDNGLDTPTQQSTLPVRTKSRREKIIHVIANPD